ncbi:hypothetical protein PLESTB_000583400 [Pleodorina starrii]|uniref:Protein kinase domain-containing protein n=1 Tax=Pleodorina starrii TaxID=330485 RepID=A0A9W6BH40_9CHLO|nr:hypothetical protein PLESTB_000583400 [Pleodorina starrii]
MEQLWALAQAQEAARLAVEKLVESAKRSRVHKEQCRNVAYAGQEVFTRLAGAVRERTGDIYILCTAAARLTSVVNSSRACVEQFGNPSRLGRLTATIFQHPRKTAERSLSDQCNALLEVAEEYASLWTSAPLRIATSGPLAALAHSPLQPYASSPAWLGDGHSRKAGGTREAGDALQPRSLTNALSSPQALPWPSIDHAMSLPDTTPRAGTRGAGLLTNSPGALGMSPQASGLRGLGGGAGGPGSESLTLSPSAASEEAEALRSLPFGQRSVRPSDGNAVQRLCFMRGAGGESAAVQLMVVLNRQVEVYSAALDSFHSDTPLDIEAQQVTATALYEPTIDLITGHRGGTVLVYGRVGAVLSASASSLRGGVLSAAAAAATAAQQAGVPLVIRLSRAAVTALHCVPAIELEAASAAAAAASASAAAAAAAAATSPATGGDDNNSTSNGGAAAAAAPAAAPSAEAVATGAIGCCTADDVLLFTGDALGRVMAVRYSRIQPEVLATTVFTTARRAASRSANSPPSEQPSSNPEITGLLYRSGCLLVSTATDMYSIRVVTSPPPPQQQQQPTSSGTGTAGANGNGSGEADGAAGEAARSPGAAANGGPPPGATLPQSTSINLLSPATSAMPTQRTASGNALPPAPTSGAAASTTAAAAASTTAAAASQPAGNGNGSEPIIRRGALNLSTTLVDSFPFADFDSCTALVAIDWPVPGAGLAPALLPAGSASADVALASASAAPYTPRRVGSTEASWPQTARAGDFPFGGLAAAAPTSRNMSIGGADGGASAAAAAGLPPGRSPKFVAAKQGPWRMLSAHMNGQLLMWDVTAGRLQLICAIGQPGPPIVNVFTFPELGTMVELLSTGHIRVGPLPTSSLAPPINPLGNVPVWQFGRASMRAHRGRLTAGAALANCIATGSRAGGVKVHSATELRSQAARQNVAFLAPWPNAISGAGFAAAAAGGGGASGAAAGGASPTASVPYPAAADPYSAVHPRVAAMRGPGSEEPPFHGGPPGGGASVMTSGPGSLTSTAAIHAPYPSNGGAYPPHAISRAPSGHMSSLASQMGVTPSAYPSMPPQMGVPGQDAFAASYPPQQQQQRVPGPSGGGAAPAGDPHMAGPMTTTTTTGSSAFANLSFAHSAAEGSDALMLSRLGGGGGGGAEQLPNGLSNGLANGLSNGHAHSHGLRSEDSMGGNLSASSSLAANGVQKQVAPPLQQAQKQLQQQRSTQGGLRPAGAAVLGTQASQGTSKASDRAAGDATPKGKVQMTNTERAVKNIFAPGASGGDDTNSKLPTVGPVGYDSEMEAAAVDAAAAALEKAGGGCGEPASPVPHPTPYYPPPRQHYNAPPSPTPAAAGASMLPPAVMTAAAVGYGASAFGDGGGQVGMSPGSAIYPHMPTAPAQRPQMVPFTQSGYNSPQPHGHMYGSPSPFQSGGGAPPSPPIMSYGMQLGSDLGAVPLPPMYGPPVGAGGGDQHVPGPQRGNAGRRPSNLSEYDMALSGGMMPLPPFESTDDVGLPPPPVVRPPPLRDPTASAPSEPQLSQNCFIRPEELRNIEQIGEGAEGIVYRGRWHHIDVAVKEMHPSSASFNQLESVVQDLSCSDSASARQNLANLIREVSALIDLGQHPNIIRFIGVSASPPRIVTEYYKLGCLYSMLKDARQGNIRTREKLSWDKRLIMLKDIAAGMAYLHSRDYIHGDLRSPNVFVTEDQHLKLGDFGFARILGKAQNNVVPARITNPRWQAPEVYDMADPIATYAADVYSFGIIMYEMLTFKLPYDDEPEDEVVKLRHTFDPSWRPHVPPDRQLPLQIRGREGQLPPLQCYKTLMMDCWAENPADRPGFHKIATRLNALCHWQWALSLIQRGLHFRQRSRPRNGTDGLSVDVTPACMTPTSMSSPTASTRAAPPAPSQVFNRILDEVANTLVQEQQLQQSRQQGQGQGQGQQQRGPGGLERHVLEGLRSDELPLAAASSPAAPPPLPLGSSPMAAPAATSQPTPVLPMLPQLPPLHPAAPQGATPAQPQPHQATGVADSPTRSRPSGGFASGRPENAAEGPTPRGSPDVPRRLSAVAAAPPMPFSEPPTLETAPTLASSGSRPLQVSAAGSPFAPSRSSHTAAAAAPPPPPVAAAAAAAPSSPPPFPAVAGGDVHTLASAFQAVTLSDDEEEEGHAGKGPRPAPPPAAAAAAAARPDPAAGGAHTAAPAVHSWDPSAATRPQPPAAGAPPPHMPPGGGAAAAHAAPSPLGTAASVAVPAAAARVAPPPPPSGRTSVTSVAAPPPLLAGASSVAVSGGTVLSRMSSFQPAPPEDPLEMRTAFHMGMGFSIEDDEDEEEEEEDE